MKIRSINAIATVLVLAATIGAQAAKAQSLSSGLRAKVPFEFYAGGQLHPAGTYIMSQVNPTTLRLQDERGRAVFISAGRETQGHQDQSWFVFHQYGNRCFLAGAYWSGSGVSLRVPASRAELEIAKNNGQPSPITIAAR